MITNVLLAAVVVTILVMGVVFKIWFWCFQVLPAVIG